MSINVRTKGQTGEREVCKMLNNIVEEVRIKRDLPAFAAVDAPFQRNQNQSAVGGSDLTNPFNLDIEVKRQENLSIETWWRQTLESATRADGIPILIFKQNRKRWRVMMWGMLPVLNGHLQTKVRVELSPHDFKAWFTEYYELWLMEEDNVLKRNPQHTI